MKFNPVIHSIFRSTWLIKPEIALSYGHFVYSMITGSDGFEVEREPMGIYAVTPSGLKIQINDIPLEGQQSIFDNAPEGSVAVIPVKGVMMKEDGMSHYGTESIGSVVMEAGRHKNIKSILLELDSGGGSVDSVAPILDAIRNAQESKPVVAWADLAASAAYWTASAANKIIASNDISSEFGSIGVMMSFADVRPMWEKEGVKFHKIYAPESNYKNLPFEKALLGDYEMIRNEELSPLAKRFQKAVRENRKGKVDITQKGILNGKMYFARDAIKVGLADEIGNREYAIKRAVEMAKKQ
jgi:protease-4